ncbi:unnamed protein product [Effrenium voratum]|nr:unnamed protein product [Effrenium voratum]
MADMLVTLTFDTASKRPPMQFELVPDKVLTVGRAPKSDVVCTLSGISWHHLDMRLSSDPQGALLVRDLSMNGTGIRSSLSQPVQKVPKDGEAEVRDGGVVCFPIRKPKAKGPDADVIQQSFVVRFEAQKPGKRAAEGQEGNEPKKRAVEADPCTQRLAKGEALVKTARQAESRGRLGEAMNAYKRGLQHIIRALPQLATNSPFLLPAQRMLQDNLERAAMVKERQGRLKLAESELP